MALFWTWWKLGCVVPKLWEAKQARQPGESAVHDKIHKLPSGYVKIAIENGNL